MNEEWVEKEKQRRKKQQQLKTRKEIRKIQKEEKKWDEKLIDLMHECRIVIMWPTNIWLGLQKSMVPTQK